MWSCGLVATIFLYLCVGAAKMVRLGHELLQSTEEERQEIRKEYGLKDDVLEEEIKAISEWFYKQPHLADAGIDSDLIEMFLIISKGSREKTKRKLDALYKGRSIHSDFFEGRNEKLDSNFMSWYRQITMPKLQKLERISVVQFLDPDPNKFFLLELNMNAYLIADFRFKFDYMFGDQWLVDLKNFGILSHLPRLNPMLLQRSTNFFQEAIGQRISGIHIVNAPPSVHSLITLFRQFLKPKIMDRVMIHDSIDNVYQYIGKEYLPKDYGGEMKSMEEYAELWWKELRSPQTRKSLEEIMNRKSDESKRPGQQTVDPLAGSFKKLDLD